MSLVNLDFEVRSFIDLPERGLDVYAKDDSTEVICMAYSIDGGQVKLWTPETALPQFMFAKDTIFQGWNVAFEVNIMRYVLGIDVPWKRAVDTMAWAAANNVPQSLEDAAIFLGTVEQKDPIGKRLIQKLCKPQKDGTFNNDPVLLKQMYDYCMGDVRTEMAIGALLRPLSAFEQEVYTLTQQINDRGVPVDPNELHNAVLAVARAQDAIDNECIALTGCKPSERAKLLEWINKKIPHAPMLDLTAETISKMLQCNIFPVIKRVLELRQEGSQTSVAKYAKMMEVQREGKIRNTLVYHGASTGRWASRGGLNLQNIARPTIEDEAIELAIPRVFNEGVGTMQELSSLVRSAIVAPPQKTFVDVDFSSIENRVGVWLAGQNDKVELFRKGLDEYKAFASSSLYQVPYEEVTKDQRQVAKSAVLGCLFGQGAKGLVKYAEGMGVKLTEGEATNAVTNYRSSYAKVKDLWGSCEAAAIEAIRNPGTAYSAGDKLSMKRVKDTLWMSLPSGRLICWQRPQFELLPMVFGKQRWGVTVHSQNTVTRQWTRNILIGSSIFQSAVQGTARDFLAHAMLRLDTKGYDVINSVHDEVLLLVDEANGDTAMEDVIKIMTTPPKWAPDFPLAAEGWVNKRYRK
jgi:DNA polymerase bacteriophage-type